MIRHHANGINPRSRIGFDVAFERNRLILGEVRSLFRLERSDGCPEAHRSGKLFSMDGRRGFLAGPQIGRFDSIQHRILRIQNGRAERKETETNNRSTF